MLESQPGKFRKPVIAQPSAGCNVNCLGLPEVVATHSADAQSRRAQGDAECEGILGPQLRFIWGRRPCNHGEDD